MDLSYMEDIMATDSPSPLSSLPTPAQLWSRPTSRRSVHGANYDCMKVKGTCTIQRAPRMHVISVYFRLNLCKLYDGPSRLLADHDFTV